MGHWALGMVILLISPTPYPLPPCPLIWEIVGFNWKLTYLVTFLNCVSQSI
jgi:hypothetical protein